MEQTAQAVIGDTASFELLLRLKNEVFDGNDKELSLALGRPGNEVQAWLNGDEEIDEDAEMKIHGLAQERLNS